MDPLMVSLRVFHIVFGTILVGNAVFLALILGPKLRVLGPPVQGPVMSALMPLFIKVQATSVVVIYVTGVYITLKLLGSSLDTFFSTGWGWAILFGTIATIAATIVGFGISVPTSNRMNNLGRSFQGRPPTPEEMGQMQRLGARLTTLGNINAVLALIALGAMAAARYV